MIEHIFITPKGELHPHWSHVFPDAKSLSSFSQISDTTLQTVIWVEWPRETNEQHYQQLNQLLSIGRPVVVMSLAPNKAQAVMALSLGAKGYCHSLCSCTQLHEISVVVANHGLWVGPEIMQVLINSSKQLSVSVPKQSELRLDVLTKREKDIARCVVQGLNNKQVAQQLNITERTVKSHLSFIFKKLTAKDRLQLALLLKDIDF